MDFSELTCPTCYQPFDKPGALKGVKAMIVCEGEHLMCESCVNQWARISVTKPQGLFCPVCKRPFFNSRRPITSRQAQKYNQLVQAHQTRYERSQQEILNLRKQLDDSKAQIKIQERGIFNLRRQLRGVQLEKKQANYHLQYQTKTLKQELNNQKSKNLKLESKLRQISDKLLDRIEQQDHSDNQYRQKANKNDKKPSVAYQPQSEQKSSSIHNFIMKNLQITDQISAKQARRRKVARKINNSPTESNIYQEEYEKLNQDLLKLEKQYNNNKTCIEVLQEKSNNHSNRRIV